MLLSILLQPQLHGSAGILDELLVYCLPLVVVIIILVRALHRAGNQPLSRERTRGDKETKSDEEDKSSQDHV